MNDIDTELLICSLTSCFCNTGKKNPTKLVPSPVCTTVLANPDQC